MYIGIHNPKNTVGGNKGSSRDLVEYLTKEEKYSEESEFVNSKGKKIQKEDVILEVDEMSKGLKQKEAKFFMLSVNPSQREQEHLLQKITGKTHTSLDNISSIEKSKYESELTKYVDKVMGKYAEGFDREVNGKKIGKEDLVYFSKVEYERKFDDRSKEVKENREIKKQIRDLSPEKDKSKISALEGSLHRNSEGKEIVSGMKKEGNQSHVHVIVCRYDKEKHTSMSPFANGKRNQDNIFGKDHIKVGFDRMNFKENCEKEFDKTFDYKREYSETIESQSMNHNKLKAMDKEGKVDGVKILEGVYEVGKFAGQAGLALATGGTSALENVMNPEKLAKKAGDILAGEAKAQLQKINPFNELLDRLNVKKQVIKEAKKVISKGGMEM